MENKSEQTQDEAQTESRYIHGDFSDVIIAIIVSLILFGGIIWFAYSYNDGKDKPLLILAGIAGAAFGWIIGILISPYNNEGKKFTEFAKIGYGFLTGYLVSKVDPLINKLVGLKSGVEPDTDFMIMVIYFFTSFVTAIALTYISRSYWIGEQKKLIERVK